jgi:drug/metabolite transporter (DMT)-like permease
VALERSSVDATGTVPASGDSPRQKSPRNGYYLRVPLLAFLAVLLAATTHATWNLYAKRAAGATHFVWLYSVASVVVYAPMVVWVVVTQRPQFTAIHWLALLGTGVLHLGYSLMLQAGYRASDLSVVYPIARGSGPLMSFAGAVLLLGERVTLLAIVGVLLVALGILLVAGLLRKTKEAPQAGIAYGLATGVFIASYTVNDGWAVKVLLISPFIIDFTGNLLRILILSPRAWSDRIRTASEIREYAFPAMVVGVLGPLGYILVLYAMRVAPIGHVAPARELATLIGTYFGARLLKERSSPERLIGALCIVGGVVSLAFAG